MYGSNYTQVPQGIISLLVEEKTGSSTLAGIATIWVCVTIMGANYATLCGYAYLPYAAAKNGDFFSISIELRGEEPRQVSEQGAHLRTERYRY